MNRALRPLFGHLIALASVVAPGLVWSAENPPNVILFLVDDMGWMDCEPYGSSYYETPNMSRLAQQSMRFTSAYALPLCSPTRASILTGQYSSRHGITSASGHQPPQPEGFDFLPKSAPANQPLCLPVSKNYLEPSQYTLAEALRDAGYTTGHFGKWHLGLTEPYWPDKCGFDVAWHCQPSPGPPGFYFSPYGVVPPGTPHPTSKGQKYIVGTITDGPDGEYITDRLTDEAVTFIDKNKNRPFFLNLWQFGVHGPWGHKETYTEQLAKKTDPSGRQSNPVMASMLKSVDDSLGRVMNKIDELGIADNTILIFYSDNGGNTHSMTKEDVKAGRSNATNPAVASYRKWAGYLPPTNNAPLREGKGRIYEGGQRVPMMVRWPGHIEPGTTSDAIVGPIDLYPTIIDMVKLKRSAEQTIDGESILPVLLKTGELQRDAYFTWFPHLIPAVSVRQGPWKLIRRFQPHRDYPDVRELYNLDDDIQESNNLAATMADKVRELDALIDDFVLRTGALYPQPNPNYVGQSAAVARKPTDGLVPKFCEMQLVDGALRLLSDGRNPFLGTAQIRHAGPMTLSLRVRCGQSSAGKVMWRNVDQTEFNEDQSVTFDLSGDQQWQDLNVELPIKGVSGIIRLYLPAEKSAVEIQSIVYRATDGGDIIRSWDFTKAKAE
ncbi:MAG: sulfatase [Planctomycetales bacterium]|nr:sulfatase [Planctomycetales bacterium]